MKRGKEVREMAASIDVSGIASMLNKVLPLVIQIAVISFLLALIFGTIVSSLTGLENLPQPISIGSICEFIISLFVDLGSSGCCRESPVTEANKCYLSSNLLAEYVLRRLCNRSDIADKIKAFLASYPIDFYDYHQIVLGYSISPPFFALQAERIDTIGDIEVYRLVRTTTEIKDYERYANLLAYESLYHIMNRDFNKAIATLVKLEGLFNGYGFADAYYQAHGHYETYKVALAVFIYKIMNTIYPERFKEQLEKYTAVLYSVSPFTTLYKGPYQGVGDLNLETASLTAIALFSDLHTIFIPSPTFIESRPTSPAIIDIISTIVKISIAVALAYLIVRALGRARAKARASDKSSGKV